MKVDVIARFGCLPKLIFGSGVCAAGNAITRIPAFSF